MTKVLLLFGSGASHGSKGLNKKPPLGRDLFEELSTLFPKTWGKIDKETSSLFKEDFELGMEKLYDEEKRVADHLKDMSIYFSKLRL